MQCDMGLVSIKQCPHRLFSWNPYRSCQRIISVAVPLESNETRELFDRVRTVMAIKSQAY